MRGRISRTVLALAPVALSVVFVGGLVGLRERGLIEPAELLAFDVMVHLRTPPASAPDVAIVTIDDEALDAWGWPVSDAALADVIEAADRAGAAAIALDVYRDRPVPPGHDRFVAALGNSTVFGAMKFATDGGSAVSPPPALEQSGRFGVVDFPVDDDGVMRRALLYIDDGTTVFPSLALSTALFVLNERGIRPAADPDSPSRMRLGAATLAPLAPRDGPYHAADTGGYQIMFDFRRDGPDIPVVDARALVADPGAAENALSGRIAFIGIASELVKDLVVSPRAGDSASGLLHGVVLHAWLADQLIRFAEGGGEPLTVPSPGAETAMIVAAGIVGLGLGLAIASPFGIVAAGLLLAAVALGGGMVLFDRDIWVPIVPGAVAALGCLAIAVGGRAATERRSRQALMRLFSQQVSREVADELWRHRDSFLDEGLPRPLRLTATVVFMDLAGSTSIADRLAPDVYMAWVGRFLERMAQTAIDHGGLVDKYTGDGLMIVFGAPVPRTDPAEIDADARAAVGCARAMAGELDRFNEAEAGDSEARARMRIGLHTGSVFAGCVGARARAQYTVMGATVNAAARLEGLKEGLQDEDVGTADCRVLMSESTAAMVRENFPLVEAGSVVLRGFSAPIRVYRLDLAPRVAELEDG